MLIQYGRQNIEHVKKRNGNWTVEGEESEDEGGGTTSHTDNSCEKKQQNGAIGNFVIAKSTDLILVPEPEMHHEEETETKVGSLLTATKEVNNYFLCFLNIR